MPDGSAISAEDVFLSKRELASELKCSLPTLDKLTERYGITAARSGGPGVPYGYRLADVQRVLGEASAAAAAAAAKKDELLSGLNLGSFGPEGDTDDELLSPAMRQSLAKAVKLERQNQQEAGELVSARAVKASLASALTILGRSLDGLPARLGRQHNLPEALVRQMKTEVEAARVQIVREVVATLEKAGADGGDGQSSLSV